MAAESDWASGAAAICRRLTASDLTARRAFSHSGATASTAVGRRLLAARFLPPAQWSR